MRGLHFLVGLSVVAIGVGMAACGSSSDDGPAVSPPAGSTGGTTGTGGTSSAGGNTQGAGGGGGSSSCATPSASGPCYPTDVSCGVTGSSCMARVSNCGLDVPGFRLSQLQVKKPAKLSNSLVEFSIVRAGIDLNLPKCNLLDGAMGSFNFLLQLDVKNNMLITGGSPPAADPDAGFCFLNKVVAGQMVNKTTIAVTKDAMGNYATSPIAKLIVPIFPDNPPTQDPILLPLSQATLTGMTVTEDNNCIGRFKGMSGELDDMTCKPLSSNAANDDAFQWKNGGSLQGYITLEEADAVNVVLTGATLCTLLIGSSEKKCPRDGAGKIMAMGDTSSIENPGSMDAFTLVSDFAASAVKVNGDCTN